MLILKSASKLLGVLVVFAALSAAQPQPSGQDGEIQVRQVLDAQVAAWNRGDLERFMAGYWHSPELSFFSNGSETKGWEQTLARYKEHYQSGGHAMGQLDFQDLRVGVLSPDAAFVRGRFHLKMPDGKEPHGVFTLVFRKFPDGWKIIHDHSSSAQ